MKCNLLAQYDVTLPVGRVGISHRIVIKIEITVFSSNELRGLLQSSVPNNIWTI